ncbi:MAG: hypothetical protein ACI4VJ_01495 [Methanosphaera sp.]
MKKRGEIANSGALIASGADATFDAVLSLSVLISTSIHIHRHLIRSIRRCYNLSSNYQGRY